MKPQKLQKGDIYKFDEETQFEIIFGAYMRLVEAIILQVLDAISISGKWKHRNLGMELLHKKKLQLNEMRRWLQDDRWDIWLDIYTEYYGYRKSILKKNFEKIRKKSIKHVNKLLKSKNNVKQ